MTWGITRILADARPTDRFSPGLHTFSEPRSLPRTYACVAIVSVLARIGGILP